VLKVRALRSKLHVRLGAAAPVIAPEVLVRIEEIWRHEKAQRGEKLFNGQLFSIHQSGPDAIIGWMAEYRHFLAQQRDPSLHAALKIRPLAVTGVLICADGIVFGRRANEMEMDAGHWELVPSGSVDSSAIGPDGRVSLERCVLTELEEETGIQASDVAAPPKAIALIEDLESHVMDVGVILNLNWPTAQIRERFATLKNREYSMLEVVAIAMIPEFRRKYGPLLSVVSTALLDILIQRV
jgi:8-oxo-dGTP pyrophosphatase MutT (NUDIX family)